ncbi:asparaginase [Endothiovibrio diazotrophicus]
MSDRKTIELTPLEKDDRTDEIQKLFPAALRQESGYAKLDETKRTAVEAVMERLAAMRFDSLDGFKSVARSLLQPVAPELGNYIDIAADNAKDALPETAGVLVIYTGGTIGSAPKDPDDPESPQVVRPWKELKRAAPQLGTLGYPVDAVSFVEPLDSCNVGPEHWRAMAQVIQEHYDRYAGFVVLHGTDSMVYTASALAFMLQELAKPVVITGSQIAGVVNARNDAHQNMVTAIMLANSTAHNLPPIPEVIIAFGNRILRGCRAKKMNVTSYQGFDTPNYAHLGVCGDHVAIERKHIRRPSVLPLQVYDRMDTNVITVEVFPGMQNSQVLANVLRDENLKGVVVKAYGAGNIPTQPAFLNLFKEFIDKGGVVVVTTSVPTGQVVMGLYETSQVLLDRGLIGGFDITSEAALCKLMMLLGNYPDDPATVRRLMQQSLVGEQSLTLESSLFEAAGAVSAGSTTKLKDVPLASCDDPERIDSVMLRFVNARLDPGAGEKATLRLKLNGHQEVGTFNRERVPQGALVADDSVGESLAIDLTRYKESFLSKAAGSSSRLGGHQMVGFEIGLEGEGAQFSWDSAELNIYVQD